MSDLERVPEYVTVMVDQKGDPYALSWHSVEIKWLFPHEAQAVIDLLVERDTLRGQMTQCWACQGGSIEDGTDCSICDGCGWVSDAFVERLMAERDEWRDQAEKQLREMSEIRAKLEKYFARLKSDD